MLPPRKQPWKSGIERAPGRVWPRHERYVRGHQCSVPGCDQGPIEFAHIRTAANSGTGIKPPSWFGVSLCSEHHHAAHQHGHKTLEKKYNINLLAIAAEFAANSPDGVMKDVMKESMK